MPGFLVEEGGMEKLVIVAISLILLTESLYRKHVTVLFCLYNRSCCFFSDLGKNALYLKNGLC